MLTIGSVAETRHGSQSPESRCHSSHLNSLAACQAIPHHLHANVLGGAAEEGTGPVSSWAVAMSDFHIRSYLLCVLPKRASPPPPPPRYFGVCRCRLKPRSCQQAGHCILTQDYESDYPKNDYCRMKVQEGVDENSQGPRKLTPK